MCNIQCVSTVKPLYNGPSIRRNPPYEGKYQVPIQKYVKFTSLMPKNSF